MKKVYLAFIILFTQFSYAQFDNETREKLIDKFTRVYNQIADEEAAKVNVTLRLGDLYAEKGRQLANDELGQGCSVCNAGDEPRKQALKYYEEAVGVLEDDKKASVLIQIGHLRELLGLENSAIQAYAESTKYSKNPSYLSEAQFSLAELYFKQRKFAEAAKNYEQVVSHPAQKGKRGFSSYRKAWSLFNMGNYEQATNQLVKNLKDPKLLNRGVNHGVVSVDDSFKDEVSRDLIIFIVKRGYKEADFQSVFDLTRKETRLSHLTNLAEELERLGEDKNAINVWSKLIKKIQDPQERWEAHIRYAGLLRGAGNTKDSLKMYDRSLSIGKTLASCQSDDCKEIRQKERGYILDWHKSYKTKRPLELAEAYDIYNKYNKAIDMEYWGAEVYLENDKKKEAFQKFERAVSKYNPSEGKDEKEKIELAKMFENSLLKRVELAEELKLSNTNQVYQDYLAKSKNKSQNYQVQYQLARLEYENKNYTEAYKAFKNFAIKTNSTDKEVVKLKEQAADLSLDALVLAKKENLIVETANELAKALPQKEKEFDAIVRKAVVNESLAVAKDDTDDGNKKALKLLKSADFTNATADEKKLMIKNKMILAEKLGNASEANGYVDQFLALSGLAKDEIQFAYKKKAWLSELMFDFKGALAATQKIEGIKEPSRTLQLALLTDLSGQDPAPLFEQFIAKNPKDEAAVDMVMELMKKSKQPWVDFKRFQTSLKTNTSKWKQSLLISYEAQPDLKALSNYIQWDTTDKDKRNEILQTQLFKPVLEQNKAKLISMQLDSSSQNKMTVTLKARMAEIKNYENFVTKVLKSELWFGQIYALEVLSKESKRFYDDVMSLPIPDGLSAEEQNQYMNLLSQNASPYLAKHNQINTKLEEIWNEKNSVKESFKNLTQQPKSIQNLWVSEYEGLAKIAPTNFSEFVQAEKTKFNQSLVAGVESSKDVPLAKVMKLKTQVMESPFNKGILEQLLDVEQQRQQDQMVIYLKQRISKLDKIKEGIK